MKVTKIKKYEFSEIVTINDINFIRLNSDYWVYPDRHRGEVTDPRKIEELEAAYQHYINPPFKIENGGNYVLLTFKNYKFAINLYKDRSYKGTTWLKDNLKKALNSLIDKE